MTDRALIGLVGQVLITIRGDAGPGEVLLPVGGTREAYVAYSDTPIERGATVLVVEAASHRQVTVVPWTDLHIAP